MDFLLSVNDLNKTFRGVHALRDYRLTLAPGEFLGIIGPNGAGKTTLFNLLTGLVQATGGSIVYDGREISRRRADQIARLGIARTFQKIRLFQALTALENVRVALQSQAQAALWEVLLSAPRFVTQERALVDRAMELLAVVKLDAVAHEPVRQLSYNQQRRLEIASALALAPRLLLLDEPTAGMNPTVRAVTIDKAMKADYAAAKAEWLAEFREDLETFLTTELIEGAVIPGRFELPVLADAQYCAFVDPSGGRQDSFTLGIAHREGDAGRIILDRLEERKPPFAPLDVIKEFSEIIKVYGIGRVTGDKYAGEFVSRSFEDAGIRYDAAKQDRSAIYLEFEPLLAQGQVELLDNKTLFAQLRGLERQTRSGGRDRVDHYQGGHDDVANAAAGACVMAAADRAYNFEVAIIPNGPEDDWEELRERVRRAEAKPMPEDTPEVKALCTEEFVVRYFAALKFYDQGISGAAKHLGIEPALLSQWAGLYHDWIYAVVQRKGAEIERKIKELRDNGSV